MLKNKEILLALFIIFQITAFGQMDKRTVKDRDFTYYFFVSAKDKNVAADDSRMYYWLHNGRIEHSEGAYYGVLLQGEFTVLNRNNQLTEQGEFKDGLKDGIWRTWDTEGKLKNVFNYKKGLLHGWNLNYDEGRLTSKIPYKRNLKHGKAVYYDSPEEEREVKYKRGSVKQKQKKIKPEKIQEIDEVEEDSLSEKKDWFRIFGRDKKKETQSNENSEKLRDNDKVKSGDTKKKKFLFFNRRNEKDKTMMNDN